MHELMHIYTLADPLFFEVAIRWSRGHGFITDAEFTISGRPTPEGWKRTRRTVWQSMGPEGRAGPEQGWKIHVSATPENADRLCNTVWDYCVPRGIPFKYLLNLNMLLVYNAKYTPRGASGKLITIYPADEAEFGTALEDLSVLMEGEAGPRILSDLRWGDGPLYVRYGGFAEMFCLDENGEVTLGIRRPDGVVVPDRRRPFFDSPAWVTVPECLTPHIKPRTGREEAKPPYRVERALHFSNAGGVYVGTAEPGGHRVVLKEARPYTALDANGADAPARLENERWALKRLQGIDGVPRLLDNFTQSGHDFLVEEYIEGEPLTVWIGVTHPWAVKTDSSEAEIGEYTRRCLTIIESLERLIAAMHARGIAFGDLHLGNVVVRPDDTVALVDFELAFAAERADWRPGLGATGFVGKGKSGPALDRHALAAVLLAMFLPFSKICVLQPGKVRQLVRLVTEEFPIPARWADRILTEMAPAGQAHPEAGAVDVHAPEIDWSAVGKSVAEGILSTATPERADRLFPGDVQQFVSGGLGLAYGAAGTLWALDVTGHGRYPEYEQWLIDAVRRERIPRRGLYDGVVGIAYVLDHFGHADVAADLLERYPVQSGAGISMFSGLSGVGCALLHAAGRYGDRHLADGIDLIAELLAEAVRKDDLQIAVNPGLARTSRPVEAGLMRGWCGPALFFIRMFERTAEPECLELARLAIHRDLDQCVANAHGALMVEEAGLRMMPYLEIGSAGIAVICDEFLAHREDEKILACLPGLLRAVTVRLSVQADLFRGKAGHVATLARIARRPYPRREMDRHLRELSWHAIAFREHTAFPGTLGLRLSMDLATGGAGVLLALAAAGQGEIPFLPFFSPRSRGG